MTYHNRIMNLQEKYPDEMTETHWEERHNYRVGHRDARHDAAEIAQGADNVIEDLVAACEKYEKAFTALLDETPAAKCSVFTGSLIVDARQAGKKAIDKVKGAATPIEELMGECGKDRSGYCSMAGTEHCDWDCPFS